MNSIYNFIVTTGNRYNNTVEVEDKELIVNTEISERDHVFVNRVATVVGTPLAIESPVKIGDQLIIHHNVFRRWYDVRGIEKNGANYIDEDKFSVAMDQVFAYNDGTGWKATPGYCFVAPIQGKDSDWALMNEITQVGYIQYGHEQLGLEKGELVGFAPESEYEFNIDGDKLYRIYLNDITWTSKRNVRELLSQPK